MNTIQTKAPYNAREVEAKWTKYWFDRQVFDLDIDPAKPSFSIALPPPNITGNLHMGHALNGTIQDVLIRWKRMQGYNVLWQPGTDHAGISTQMVVERQLKKEGKTRHALGRLGFLERVWQWRNEYGDQIFSQYKRLGVSFNWDRIAFTMDPGYVRAIMRAFVTLYREGLIYRGHRVTNWCPRCLTSLSDLEVEHEETKGHLYLINYELTDGTGSLTVATTRPESMFGDVALAVHPADDRYTSYVGKSVYVPLSRREIVVVADNYVDKLFGTGVLKITPAHDANDWEVGQRHGLSAPVVLDQYGKLMTNEYVPHQFQGKERFASRKEIVEELTSQGLLSEIQDYTHGLGFCERCHTVIEPLLSDQWYLKMQELAQSAIKMVEDERIVFVPDRYAQTYLAWMRNIRDWNISRQLWWGHRIPVWTCKDCISQEAFEQTPEACAKCGSLNIEQDPDVLDTWFSSALWPFATLGWPDDTQELRTFYPTTVLSTAREIINLWVARMIFASLKFLGTIPFKNVVVHPVIQTSDGKRMSKSKGNAIDPLDMIDKYGADANRFWFASVGVRGDQDVRFREDRLEEYKRFANKLWNAGRFVLSSLEGFTPHAIEPDKLTLPDRWILHRFNILLRDVHEGLRNYNFDDVSKAFYEFTWDAFCDWYLEIVKIQLAEDSISDRTSQTDCVLQVVFEGLLRALHPIMPFLTEELWQRTPKSPLFAELDSIMFAPYPRQDESLLDEDAEKEMGLLIRIIRAIRNIRHTYNVPASSYAEVIIHCSDTAELKCLFEGQEYIKRLARVNPISILHHGMVPAMVAKEMISCATVYVPLATLIDVDKSKDKLMLRQEVLAKDLEKVRQVLENKDFQAKAPKEKVETLQLQLTDLEKQMESIEAQLKVLALR
ncbi:MAG: valine--tRNA ligase [Candidatus Melainabacteria bacterium]|nr:valine--tRNA ligase [Candidatus Melainabacteria bacterium]